MFCLFSMQEFKKWLIQTQKVFLKKSIFLKKNVYAGVGDGVGFAVGLGDGAVLLDTFE